MVIRHGAGQSLGLQPQLQCTAAPLATWQAVYLDICWKWGSVSSYAQCSRLCRTIGDTEASLYTVPLARICSHCPVSKGV